MADFRAFKTAVYLEVTPKTEKPLGLPKLVDIVYTSYDHLRDQVMHIISDVKNVPVDSIILQKMIYYPGKKTVPITKSSDVLQAQVQKNPTLGVVFGKLYNVVICLLIAMSIV